MYSTTVLGIIICGFAFTKAVPTCSQNEEFKQCGSLCAPTCEQNAPKACAEVCAQGCFCKNGFLRRTRDGPCVPLEACAISNLPKPVTALDLGVPKCRENEEFATCGSLCPETCVDQGPQVCAAVCVESCVCKEGFVRKTRNGGCVAKSSC